MMFTFATILFIVSKKIDIMTFLQSMEQRYTTKKYDPSKKLTSEQRIALQNILRLSPSSINSQPWKFTFVQTDDLKKRLSEVSWLNKSKVLDSDTLVVFHQIDDIALFEQQIEGTLPEGAVNYYKEFIKPQPKEQIKAWFGKQVYLALGVFLSACATMGIDATPMEGIEPDQYDNILGLEGYSTLVAVAIGHRDLEDFNQPSKNPKSRRPIDQIIQSV